MHFNFISMHFKKLRNFSFENVTVFCITNGFIYSKPVNSDYVS